jgi:hypothetical protein
MRRAAMMRSRRLVSSEALTLGDYRSVRIVPFAGDNRMALVAARPFVRADPIFCFSGMLRRDNAGMRSLQVGSEAHLLPPSDEEEPWELLNHSFAPTVRLSHESVASAEARPPLVTATAAEDLSPGTMLTIDCAWLAFDPSASLSTRGCCWLARCSPRDATDRASPAQTRCPNGTCAHRSCVPRRSERCAASAT